MTTHPGVSDRGAARTALGAVAFLNARPLVEGLDEDPRIRLEYAVPSVLFEWLVGHRVAASLIPVVDLVSDPPVKPVSDACIASDGETLTVRVFSRVPPGGVDRLRVDGDSHTSVVLAKVMWKEMFGRIPRTTPLREVMPSAKEDGVLLIGDKVITHRPRGFAFEVDLGAAWRELTGLPFVYAVWAMLADEDPGDLPELLSRSRDLGVSRLSEIAERRATTAGWPVDIARRYLAEYMDYRMTDRHREGMELFLGKTTELGLLEATEEVAQARDA